ncbi:MAG TPA: ABC transporter ATP-binding protein [Thermaerobacter sp.]
MAQQQAFFALIRRLNREEGRTIVMVLHDVNDAAQVSDHLIVMREGRILAQGAPEAVLKPNLLEQAFGVPCDVLHDPGTHRMLCVPRSRAAAGCALPPAQKAPAALAARRIAAGYGERQVFADLSVTFPAGKISAIVGPNGCGKSTLLKALARLLPLTGGTALLGDRPITAGSHRAFARQLALLSQHAVAPDGVLVEDLVATGRYPHQCWYRQWSREDQEAVERAMDAAGVAALRLRPVESLSGGQRQRAWLAMALAQETPVLLLDEPTSFLDLAHQVEVLDLVWRLNRSEGKTVIMVVHDLTQASRYADHLVVMKEGRVVAAGPPEDVLSAALVQDVFGVESTVIPDPVSGTPLVFPGRPNPSGLRQGQSRRAAGAPLLSICISPESPASP